MSELNASNLRKEHGNESPDLVGVTELTSPYFMVPPSGTQQRDQKIQNQEHYDLIQILELLKFLEQKQLVGNKYKEGKDNI